MRLVLLGPPGAGKGTQAVRLAEHFRCPVIATGEVFRSHVAEGTPLGRLAQEYLDRGDLVPDEVVINMVMERLAAETACDPDDFVLDGFPRTVAQAEALDTKLAAAGVPLDAALFFEISEDELFRRLAGRSATLHRADDTEHTIRHRLEVFAIKTRPLVDHYERRGLLERVDAIGDVNEVTRRILKGLEQRSR
ncbi:MAG TPA: adenylate kinase [Actinomycetes bacterium]|jgi:adenylate kinase|nr:adenylate kinase [Actinomycetes bacterium]